ncbi:MAG: aminoacyl-tRNA hydrolase [Deltaproteobacteria bacterium]|nr:aminoacyl-tRNA hydrolase [Deltaproteobacteria bacterium]
MEADLPIDATLTVPGEELSVSTSRAGGPGGQHVNTTESRVSLRWNVATTRALDGEARARLVAALGSRLTAAGELLVHVGTDRSQHANREEARARLAEIVRAARKPRKSRRPTRPTRGSQLRRLGAKKARADRLKNRGGGHDD